ncbi:hypothetical protein HY488_02815 [Candidatus Woesearchaeota archaeon]|nr:hypothetical protein [Candidatus Woesearchaeota archaeon]
MVKFFASRKGIFLTFIAVLMVTLLLLYASTQYEVSYKDTVPTETLRITGLNNFISDFEETYLERALFASSHRALAALINATPDGASGSNVQDIHKEFEAAVINATINDGTILLPSMENHTLSIWIQRLSNFSRDNLRVDLFFNITDVNISQDESTGPWLLNVSINLDYRANSSDTTWERTNVTIRTTFDIFGFEDPYLKFKTDNQINRTIQRFNFTGENYLPENVTDLITSKNFIYDKRAPSFLGRFQTFNDPDSRSSCCGIFSLVSSIQEPPATLSYTDSDRTYADFTYLDDFCFSNQLYTVNDVSGAMGIGSFYLDEYFVDKVFGLAPDATQEANSPDEGDTCGS